MAQPYIKRPLFGGAIVADTAPDLLDASLVRQIPDTQEVFMYKESDVSIIVEILQRVEPSTYDDAIKFHFDSLAEDNSAASAQVHDIFVIPNDREDATPSAIVLLGLQMVSKFNSATLDEVLIFMALFRIEEKATDIVVTFNAPKGSSDGRYIGEERINKIKSQFDTFVRTFSIMNFDLFC
ncbi:Mog1p/PsbP-like protein [Cyathus striatus]|nr:Mog1p/PsbP-like protein [Cyathus striatus]